MTNSELKEIVEQEMDDPFVLGRLANKLHRNDVVEQRHHDGRHLEVFWRDTGSFWRCTIFLDATTEMCLVQIDLHRDSTVRVEAWEPCSVTISLEDDLLCLTRFRKADSQNLNPKTT